MPESFRCEECGKSFPTEGDVREHTQLLHGSAGMGEYKQSDAASKNEEDVDVPVAPVTPKTSTGPGGAH